MFPEAQEIENSITIRKMRSIGKANLTRNGLVRWFALSLGLLNPRDKRQTIVSIIDALLFFNMKKNQPAQTKQICDRTGLDEKTVLYHLSRLKRIGLVEQRRGGYEIVRDVNGNLSLERVKALINESLDRSQAALLELERIYSE